MHSKRPKFSKFCGGACPHTPLEARALRCSLKTPVASFSFSPPTSQILPSTPFLIENPDIIHIYLKLKLTAFFFVILNTLYNILPTQITYHLLIESEVITGKSQTEMYWCIDWAIARSVPQGRGLRFPCNDRTDEVNKLFIIYGLFSTFLKKNTIRTPEVIFHIRLRALWLSSSLILKCFCMLV